MVSFICMFVLCTCIMESLEDVYGSSFDYTEYLRFISKVVVVLSFIGFLIGIISASTPLLYFNLDLEFVYIIKFGAVVGGFSVLLMFTGIVVLLPHTDTFKLYWFSGKLFSISGIVVFFIQYPESWSIYEFDTMLLSSGLYLTGVFLLVLQIVMSINSLFEGSIRKQIVSREIVRADEVEEFDSSSKSEGSEGVSNGGSSVGFAGEINPDDIEEYRK